jgi:hypothetical protein
MRSPPAAWQDRTARWSHDDPARPLGVNIDTDRPAAFYVRILQEISLPVGSPRKAALIEKTSTPKSPVPAISDAIAVLYRSGLVWR